MSDDLLDKHLYLGLMWACFTGLLLEGHGLAGRLLCSRPLAFLGIFSYSTYLFHWLILMTLAGHWPGHMATFLIGIFLSIAAGAAGHYLAERPLEKLAQTVNGANTETTISAAIGPASTTLPLKKTIRAMQGLAPSEGSRSDRPTGRTLATHSWSAFKHELSMQHQPSSKIDRADNAN
ncbi:acyltransferase family protein [Azotobacter vinelandii]